MNCSTKITYGNPTSSIQFSMNINHSHEHPETLIPKIGYMNLYEVIMEIGKVKMDIYTFKTDCSDWSECARHIAIDKQLLNVLEHQRDVLKTQLAARILPTAMLHNTQKTVQPPRKMEEVTSFEVSIPSPDTAATTTPVESPLLNSSLFDDLAEVLLVEEPTREETSSDGMDPPLPSNTETPDNSQ